MSVRVLASDGVTPVVGATIGWSGTNGVQISACGGASSCSAITDQNGDAATWLTAAAAGASYVTATLAPGVYSPSKSVTGTLGATESSSDIGVITPSVYVCQEHPPGVPPPTPYVCQQAIVSLPVQARVLSNGSPQNNAQVNFSIVSGSGSLSAASASTDPNGYAAVTVSFSNFAATVSVNACVAPSNARCAIFSANPTPREQLVLQQVSGAGQISTGAPFQPLTVRVMDSAPVPHPVLAAPVSFLTTVMRSGGRVPGTGVGDTNSGNPSMPVILKVTLTNATSDGNGLASITPSSGGFSAPVEVDVSAAAGTTAFLDNPLLLLPAPSVISSSQSSVAVKNHPVWGSGR